MAVSLSRALPGVRRAGIADARHAGPGNFQANQWVAVVPCRMPPPLCLPMPVNHL